MEGWPRCDQSAVGGCEYCHSRVLSRCICGIVPSCWWHGSSLSISSYLIISYTYFLFILQKDFDVVAKNTLFRLGFLSPYGLSSVLTHVVTPLLFLGPLFCSYLRQELPFQRNWMWQTHVVARFLSIHGLRNYLIVSTLRFPYSMFLICFCYIGSNDGRNCV